MAASPVQLTEQNTKQDAEEDPHRMTTPLSHTAPLRADCIADSAGGLTFDVSATGATEPAHLVLRHREGREEVTLPLTPATKGHLRAALPSSVALPEGHWDAYARVTDEEPHRLAPGAMKVHSLASRVPYETRQGNLSVECRLTTTPLRGAGNCATSHNGPALAREPVPPSY